MFDGVKLWQCVGCTAGRYSIFRVRRRQNNSFTPDSVGGKLSKLKGGLAWNKTTTKSLYKWVFWDIHQMNRDLSTSTIADLSSKDEDYRLDVHQISDTPDMDDGIITKKSMAEWRSERQRTIEPRYPKRWFGSKRVTSAMFAGCNLLTMVDSLFGFYLLDQ